MSEGESFPKSKTPCHFTYTYPLQDKSSSKQLARDEGGKSKIEKDTMVKIIVQEGEEARDLAEQLNVLVRKGPMRVGCDWTLLADSSGIERSFTFKTFAKAW
ncbi:hypothetical protein MMC09_000243, partial [Bachmanniomyces sp. S44760]|nr:hypothetical protein [Bachmanniomyces sp. S44760]